MLASCVTQPSSPCDLTRFFPLANSPEMLPDPLCPIESPQGKPQCQQEVQQTRSPTRTVITSSSNTCRSSLAASKSHALPHVDVDCQAWPEPKREVTVNPSPAWFGTHTTAVPVSVSGCHVVVTEHNLPIRRPLLTNWAEIVENHADPHHHTDRYSIR